MTTAASAGHGRHAARQAREWLPALLVLVGTIAIWEGAVKAFDIQNFLLPAPTDIGSTLWDQKHTLFNAGWFTFKEALGGFVVGSVAGIVFATIVARFPIAIRTSW